jgi:hypothetical protein
MLGFINAGWKYRQMGRENDTQFVRLEKSSGNSRRINCAESFQGQKSGRELYSQ